MDVNENIAVETSEEEVKEETVEVVKTEETAEANAEETVNNDVAEVSEDDPVEESTTEETVEVESSEGSVDNEQAEEEIAMNTERDIRRMIRIALNEMKNEEYMDVAFVFPEDKIILVQNWNMKELEYVQYSYRVDGDKVVLDNEKKVELTISPLQINFELEKKNSAIAEANERIVALESQVAELNKVKEELDAIKAEKANSEHAEAVEKLRNYVVNSGRFTKEELESPEISEAIENLNEAWIKSEIADRLVASLSKEKKIDTSEIKDDKTVGIVLSDKEENESVSPTDVMRAFFNN